MFLNRKQKLIAVPRPYTTYNVFFQLEREYILQRTLRVIPNLQLSEIFHHDSEVYTGPPLPSRYAELILHREWHVPGKGRRNKRSHRASHGKIGFKELSKQIAKSWASADWETKKFCKACSEYCKLQYKLIRSNMEMWQTITPSCQAIKQAKSSDLLVDAVISNPDISMLLKDKAASTIGRGLSAVQETTCTCPVCQVTNISEPCETISTEEINGLLDNDFAIEGHPVHETHEALNSIIIDTLFSGMPFSVNDEALVDMEDNKIIDLWYSMHYWSVAPAFDK